jgi:hypothetical protein
MLDELFERAARADDDQVIAAVVLEGAVERQHKSRGGRELGELRSASATYTLLWNENSLPLPVVANTLLAFSDGERGVGICRVLENQSDHQAVTATADDEAVSDGEQGRPVEPIVLALGIEPERRSRRRRERALRPYRSPPIDVAAAVR